MFLTNVKNIPIGVAPKQSLMKSNSVLVGEQKSVANAGDPISYDTNIANWNFAAGVMASSSSNTTLSSQQTYTVSLPISSNFGELINYEPTQMSPQNVPNMHVQSLTVRVLDEYGEAVDFNNRFWSLSLSIQWAMDVGSSGMEDITMGRTHRPVYFNGGHDPLNTYPEFVRNLKRRFV